MGEKTTGQKAEHPLSSRLSPSNPRERSYHSKVNKGICLWFWFFKAGREEVSNQRKSSDGQRKAEQRWTLVHLFSVLARESPTDLSEFQACTS